MEKVTGFRIDFVEPIVYLLMTWMQVLRERKRSRMTLVSFALRTESIGLLFIEMGIPREE